MKETVVELIVDDEITLRQLAPSDAKAFLDLLNCNRFHLSQYGDETGAKYGSEEEVLNEVIKPINSQREEFGIWVNDTLVGVIDLVYWKEEVAKLAYWLGCKYEGKRLASRSARRLIDYAFTEKGYSTILATVHGENLRSIHLLENCGFVKSSSYRDIRRGFYAFEIKKENEPVTEEKEVDFEIIGVETGFEFSGVPIGFKNDLRNHTIDQLGKATGENLNHLKRKI